MNKRIWVRQYIYRLSDFKQILKKYDTRAIQLNSNIKYIVLFVITCVDSVLIFADIRSSSGGDLDSLHPKDLYIER